MPRGHPWPPGRLSTGSLERGLSSSRASSLQKESPLAQPAELHSTRAPLCLLLLLRFFYPPSIPLLSSSIQPCGLLSSCPPCLASIPASHSPAFALVIPAPSRHLRHGGCGSGRGPFVTAEAGARGEGAKLVVDSLACSLPLSPPPHSFPAPLRPWSSWCESCC